MKFYQLEHIRYYRENEFSDQKLIGVYSSRELAEDKKLEYEKKEGFNNNPNGFLIKEFILDDINYIDGFTKLYTD